MARRNPRGLCVLFVAISTSLGAQANRPVRTFPEFVGTWVLDEAASTGQLNNAPRTPLTLTIAITATEITVATRLRLHPRDTISDSPPPAVYRLDGTETEVPSAELGIDWEVTRRFTLVADILALTTKQRHRGRGTFTSVTDALVVDGDVLTLHRQLASMTASGEILTMQEPRNNFRHTFIYRRAAE